MLNLGLSLVHTGHGCSTRILAINNCVCRVDLCVTALLGVWYRCYLDIQPILSPINAANIQLITTAAQSVVTYWPNKLISEIVPEILIIIIIIRYSWDYFPLGADWFFQTFHWLCWSRDSQRPIDNRLKLLNVARVVNLFLRLNSCLVTLQWSCTECVQCYLLIY